MMNCPKCGSTDIEKYAFVTHYSTYRQDDSGEWYEWKLGDSEDNIDEPEAEYRCRKCDHQWEIK